MNITKMMLSVVILGSTLLIGCSSSTKIEELSTDIQTLNAKFDQLSSDLTGMSADIQAAKDDASRANQRLDNQVLTYKK